MRAQAWSICSSRCPWADIRAVTLALSVASFYSAAVRVQGAPGFPGFGLSAKAPVLRSSRVPTRLTIRSSRRRISASLKLAAERAILVLHCCGRRGLTQALGGRKAFCRCVARKSDFLASVSAALRSGSRHVASSVKYVWRAHTSHALRLQASETAFDVGHFSRC